MAKKEVKSFSNFIEKILNTEDVIIAHKKEYRTTSTTGIELAQQIKKIRHLFQKQSIKPGHKIMILGKNSVNWIAVYFAAILSGVTVIPLDLNIDTTLLNKIQKQVKAKAIFLDRQTNTNVKKFYFDQLPNLPLPSAKITKPSIRPDQVLQILYTSGTTGDPKGVILTHQNMLAGINAAIKTIPLTLRLRFLHLLPLSHIFGQVPGLFMLLYFRHKIYFIDSVQPRQLISYIRNKRLHAVIIVPGLLNALKNHLEGKFVMRELGLQFRLIGIGGAFLDKSLESWWKRRLILVLQGYGLTETASMVSANNLLLGRTGSVGKIAKSVEIKLGQDNEIMVKGKNITKGYYQNKQKTAKSFSNGWFKTGDIGEIKNGYLYLKERKKDIIVTSSGINVYPIDIEQILNKSIMVKDSCVFQRDNHIHAVLILKKKHSLASIIKNANKKLLTHQRINNYSLWPYKEFPKTATGKIKKFEVKKHLGQKPIRQHQNQLYAIINQVLNPQQKVTSKQKLVDLGMDSLKRVELISALEQEYSVEIDETDLNQYTKITHLQNLLLQRRLKKIHFRKWPLLVRPISWLTKKILIFPLISLFTPTTYQGLENLKNLQGPVIFAANHQSAWDPIPALKKIRLPIAIAGESNYVFGIGTKGSIFLRIYRKITGFLASFFFNAYPFGESIGTRTSLSFTGEFLDRGYSILIFPEAHRTPDGKIKTFKPGIGYLALHMHVPIVPVKLEGLFKVLPLTKIIPRFGKIKVTFGKPINIHDISYVRATKLIEKKVREL
tara:strand:- start:31626 stop:33956 length:2331 start_codon:yes stop_codon:yes gene_type:complete